ncbi:hypothetical protein FIBSPDRAFT_932937 [Athelia psychrophila]|uniref:Cytochrome P450 n=1 Tax=Athelia psychrophila TaxID=1759441 RepID=A0A166HUG3_9AGAM|nr:hypothetical protein FIBSPDRAFT_932937 [Fibularhizoctonia sp. CBS 109695]
MAAPNGRAVEGEAGDERAETFTTIFSTARKFRIMTILQAWFPLLSTNPKPPQRRNNKTIAAAQSTVHHAPHRHLIDKCKVAIVIELAALNSTVIDGDSTVLGRDPLSVLIRSKLATAATPAAQLSSSETLLQISMFIAAGFETTSSALSWALFALSGAPGAQMKLRDAMRAVPAPPQGGERDDAWVSALDALPYLDWTEQGRDPYERAVGGPRRADKDGDRDPAGGHHQCADAGGQSQGGRVADEGVLRPEWWAASASSSSSSDEEKHSGGGGGKSNGVPGLYAGILTFLNGSPLSGNRACIG